MAERKRGRPITRAARDGLIVCEYQQGASVLDLALLHGINPSYVYQILAKAKVEMRHVEIDRERVADIMARLARGDSYAMVASTYGISRQRVYQIARRERKSRERVPSGDPASCAGPNGSAGSVLV